MTDSPRAHRPRAPKPLKWIVADLLARHVDELVDAAGESLRHVVPCDVRDALLAVARRRRCLDDATLRALVDDSTTIIDASGCGGGRVTDAGIAALAARRALRNVTAVDLSRCDGVTAAGLRILARAAPRLRTLRCGGDATCNAACEAAMPGIVPRLEDGGGVDDWETRAEAHVDSTDVPTHGDDFDCFEPCRARATSLEWLVWPDVRPDTRATISRQCPRIRIVAPPREVHLRAAAAVTDPSFAAVAGEGWIGFGRPGIRIVRIRIVPSRIVPARRSASRGGVRRPRRGQRRPRRRRRVEAPGGYTVNDPPAKNSLVDRRRRRRRRVAGCAADRGGPDARVGRGAPRAHRPAFVGSPVVVVPLPRRLDPSVASEQIGREHFRGAAMEASVRGGRRADRRAVPAGVRRGRGGTRGATGTEPPEAEEPEPQPARGVQLGEAHLSRHGRRVARGPPLRTHR